MKKHLIFSSLISLMVCILLCGASFAGEDKTLELNRKMDEISSLQQSLSQKISLATQKKAQLRQNVTELEKEIKQEIAQLQIKSYLGATRSPRIEFDLKLIQLLIGYTAGIDEKISYFQNGFQTLAFFQQQAQDDLRMLKTLNDMEIDKLIIQIDLILDEFLPELGKPVFDTRNVHMKNLEAIWNEIIQQQKVNG